MTTLHTLEISENDAIKLVSLLHVMPIYTSDLPDPYEKVRAEWMEKMGEIFPSLNSRGLS